MYKYVPFFNSDVKDSEDTQLPFSLWTSINNNNNNTEETSKVSKEFCRHEEIINVGFHHDKLVCKHCDADIEKK